jgi:hypothetical protein
MIALTDFDRAGRQWSFDPDTGEAEPLTTDRCHGFLHLFEDANGSHLAAAFSDGTRLVLAIDARSWNVAEVDLSHERRWPDRTCTFQVAGNGSVDYSLTYHDPLADRSQIELMTLDGIDLAEDFFFWAAGLPTRLEAGIALWSTGFDPLHRKS